MASKKMKDNKRWYCAFYYTDWTGARKKKKKEGFLTKKEADEFEKNFLEKLEISSNINFKTLVDIYFEDCKKRLKYTTVHSKSCLVNANITPYFENYSICDITPNHIRNWQNEMISKGFSNTYLNTMHNQLSAIFNFARKFYNLNSNPAQAAGSIGKTKAREMLFWTHDEFKKFIEKVDEDTYKVIFNILYYTGIRLGELMALTPKDVKDDLLIINKTYTRIDGEDIITSTKTTKGNRKVPISKFLSEMIQDYLSSLYKPSQNERIFLISKSAVGRSIVRFSKLANVKPIRTHDLRHSHSSLLIELGYSPLLIAERLGHEDIQTTLRTYSHLYPHKQADLINKLDELVRNEYELEKIKARE